MIWRMSDPEARAFVTRFLADAAASLSRPGVACRVILFVALAALVGCDSDSMIEVEDGPGTECLDGDVRCNADDELDTCDNGWWVVAVNCGARGMRCSLEGNCETLLSVYACCDFMVE